MLLHSPQPSTTHPPSCFGDQAFHRYFLINFSRSSDPDTLQAARHLPRATGSAFAAIRQNQPAVRLSPCQIRLLSDQVRAAIDKAVESAPVVLFMKGTPEMPQCGFSRASVQILGMQGVDPAKFTAFNVLEDQDLRTGTIPRSQ